MSNREALRKELAGLPDPLVGKVVDFVRVLKAKRKPTDAEFRKLLRESFGIIPDLMRPPQGETPAPRELA